MTKHANTRLLLLGAVALTLPRAIAGYGVRADANATEILNGLKTSFEALQASLDEKIKAKADVLIDEKIDRVNTTVGEMQGAIDALNLRLAADALNAGRDGKKQLTAEQRAHTKAFGDFASYGDAALGALKADGIQAAHTAGSGPDGGYLVPVEIDPTVDRVAAVQGGLYSIANVRPTKGSTYKKLVSQGGATTGWVGETETRPATSTATLSEIEIELGQVYVNAPASQQILDDGDIEGWLRDEVMISFDEAKGVAVVTGNGIKRPRGLMSYTMVTNASYAWGSVGYIPSGGAADFAATVPDNALLDMISALKQPYRPNARWIGNRGTIGKVRKFKDTTGNPLWQPSLQLGQPATLLGYPVTEDDNFADVGANTYPLAFGDFKKAYTVAEKAGLQVNIRDPYTNKPYVMFYMVQRVGGGITNFEAFKALKIATT